VWVSTVTRCSRTRDTLAASPGGTLGGVICMIAHAFSTGSALLPGSGSEPAITRLANGRLANAQLRLSDGQKAHSRPPVAANPMRVDLRVQLCGSGIGRVQWSPSSRVRYVSQYVLGRNAARL